MSKGNDLKELEVSTPRAVKPRQLLPGCFRCLLDFSPPYSTGFAYTQENNPYFLICCNFIQCSTIATKNTFLTTLQRLTLPPMPLSYQQRYIHPCRLQPTNILLYESEVRVVYFYSKRVLNTPHVPNARTTKTNGISSISGDLSQCCLSS